MCWQGDLWQFSKRWDEELGERMAIMATMLDPKLSLEEARWMTTAAVRLGHCMVPF